MSVHEHLQIKEHNGRFFCGIVVALFFVQTTNESKWETGVKLLVQRNSFAI